MNTIHENVSTESDDDKLSDVTLTNESEDRNSKRGKKPEEKEIRAKLQHYESYCKRYGLQKVTAIQNCIREQPGAEICNLDHYGIGSLQCQVGFEAFSKPPVTRLTSISLKNNQLESFCCHSIASFIEISTTLKELMLDGCKYVAGFRIRKFSIHDLAYSKQIRRRRRDNLVGRNVNLAVDRSLKPGKLSHSRRWR